MGDVFGGSVSMSGNLAMVGAYNDDGAGLFLSGSAYMYRYNGRTWEQEQKLTASDAAEADRFSSSISVSGDVAVVGAYGNDDAGAQSGSAYMYRYNGSTWVEEQKLTASDAAMGDYFGSSVSVSGNAVVVGSPYDDNIAGSAYVFDFSGVTISVPGDFGTIQEAINAAQGVDCILVSPGTYVENIDFLGKAITLKSTDGSEVTTIDGSDCTTGFNNCSVVMSDAFQMKQAQQAADETVAPDTSPMTVRP